MFPECIFLIPPVPVTVPMISPHPTNAGTDVSFSVTATGGELVYQWMKDGVDIFNTPFKYVGTNTSILIVLSVNDPDDEGAYSVTVGYAAGKLFSNESIFSIGNINCQLRINFTASILS